MDKPLYVMILEKTGAYKRLNKAAVARHVENIRKLDMDGNMRLCGVLKGWPGVAGMIIIKADSREEAEALCKREPLVAEGYATYRLITMLEGNQENNYLL